MISYTYQMVAAEERAVGCALLKRSIYSNRTVSSPAIRVYQSFSRDAASHGTRFTAATATLIYTDLLSCNSRTACMQYSQKESYENNR